MSYITQANISIANIVKTLWKTTTQKNETNNNN